MNLADVAALSWEEVRARPEQGAARRGILRTWLAAHPLALLRFLRPSLFFSGFPAGPKRDLALAFAATPRADPGRPPIAILGEQGRGLGKTQIARWSAVARALEGEEQGVAFFGASAPDAQKHTAAIIKDIPALRAAESPSDATVRAWTRSPMGSLYPTLRVEGGVMAPILHLAGRRIPLWARGRSGSTRGLELDGIRPSLVVLDDLVTLEAATSEKQAADHLKWVHDDAANLGTQAIPAAVWWIGNAIAAGDSLDLASASGRWNVIRGTVWTPHAPPDSAHKRDLLADLLALPQHLPIPDELIAKWAPRLTEILAGACPTDPDQDPLALLRIEALMGPRAFARACMCLRLAEGEALWPMDRAHLVRIDGRELVWPDGERALLSACTGAVWLDPRGSESADANDYAAAAAVVRAPSGRRACLAIEAERCPKARQRELYWLAVDALFGFGVRSVSGGYETNNGANLAFDADWPVDAKKRRDRGLQAPIPAGVNSGAQKYGPERLDRVTDHIGDGRLAFLAALYQGASWRRMAAMPGGHDDDGDAVERADNLLLSKRRDPWAAMAPAIVAR